MSNTKYYTVTQSAKVFGVSRQYVHQMIREGKIKPTISMPGMKLLSRDVVTKAIKDYFAHRLNTLE